jgi:hypothetical protein
MNFRLKTLMAAAIALVALGVGTSTAQAAEFHCSVQPCRYTMKTDGTGKTGHNVLILESLGTTESVSLTCNEISGSAVSATKTTSQLTVENIAYTGCTVNGSAGVEFVMNSCDYRFASSGTMSIVGCNAGKKIEIKLAAGGVYTIGEQGPLAGVTYHTIGTTPNRETTASTDSHGSVTNCDGTLAQCLANPGAIVQFTYTTGNIIFKGESEGGVMADQWFE